MKKFLKSDWFGVIIVIIGIVLINRGCSSCGCSSCELFSCDLISCNGCSHSGKTLDLTNDFTEEEIARWKNENKEDQNKNLLNGGYYINFKDVNYPVVFTSGKITQFDNMPDELFFIEMSSFYFDKDCKNVCALLLEFNELYSNKANEYYKGYVFYENRPKNGTILYLDETNERKIVYGKDIYNKKIYGVDDCIDDYYLYDDAIIITKNGALALKDNNGKFLEECNTVRKLYYYAKENGVEFDSRLQYEFVPYPSCLFYFFEEPAVRYFDHSESCSRKKIFYLKNYESSMINKYSMKVKFKEVKTFNNICFKIDYNDASLSSEYYHVTLGNSFSPIYGYSNTVKDEDGKIISYTYQDMNFKVFYGSITEFNQFLMSKNYIDEINHQIISHYSFNNETDFMENIFEISSKIILDASQKNFLDINSSESIIELYAVWDNYSIVTLYGNEETQINVFKTKEYVLPTPQKGGFEFKGWYKTSDFQGEQIEKIAYDDNITELYAKFEKVDYYTISFEPYGGQSFEDITYSYGDEVMLPVLSKAFHLFKGWCLDSDLTTEPVKAITKDFSGSYHLYPCFEPLEFTIRIIDSDEVIVVKVKYGEKDYTLPVDRTKEGFLGYFDAYGNQYTDNLGNSLEPFTEGADVQLFARYQTEEN